MKDNDFDTIDREMLDMAIAMDLSQILKSIEMIQQALQDLQAAQEDYQSIPQQRIELDNTIEWYEKRLARERKSNTPNHDMMTSLELDLDRAEIDRDGLDKYAENGPISFAAKQETIDLLWQGLVTETQNLITKYAVEGRDAQTLSRIWNSVYVGILPLAPRTILQQFITGYKLENGENLRLDDESVLQTFDFITRNMTAHHFTPDAAIPAMLYQTGYNGPRNDETVLVKIKAYLADNKNMDEQKRRALETIYDDLINQMLAQGKHNYIALARVASRTGDKKLFDKIYQSAEQDGAFWTQNRDVFADAAAVRIIRDRSPFLQDFIRSSAFEQELSGQQKLQTLLRIAFEARNVEAVNLLTQKGAKPKKAMVKKMPRTVFDNFVEQLDEPAQKAAKRARNFFPFS